MKATEITMQIVKNLGNYETCRLEATFTLDEGDDLRTAFKTARQQLEDAYNVAYDVKKDNRKVLELNSKEFDRVCKALHEGRTDFKELIKLFIIDNDVRQYLRKHNLI